MRILMGAIRYPPAPGGAETHVHEVSKQLVSRGHHVQVITSDLNKETPFTKLDGPYPEYEGIQIKRYCSWSPGGEYHYVLFPGVTWPMLTQKVDLFHVHSYGYFHVNAAAFMKRIRNVPLVITPHFHPAWSMWGGDQRKKVRGVYDRIIAPFVLDSADIIIGVSHHEVEQMKSSLDFDHSKVRYIPNGIDFSRFEQIPEGRLFRDMYGVPDTSPVVLYTGRLAVNKGLDTLLTSFAEVLKEFPDCYLCLVGDDQGMGDKLRKQANELGISGRIVFTGHIEERIFRDAYGAADVFVLPSEYEAFGIVLLEAMACRVPCIGTRVGGVPEVIREGTDGLLVEYKDSSDLARSMIRLLSDVELREKMGETGRERVRREFTWSSVVDRIEEVYRELV
jgi:glycosyltransferase involved in cell wall biosynthesis